MPLVTLADLNAPDVQDWIARARGVSKLYDQYVEDDEGNAAERAPGIHASEVSGCKRKIVYSLLAFEKRGRISKNWRQRFQVGHAIHAMIQNDFYGMAEKSNGTIHFAAERDIAITPETSEMAAKWFINSSTDGVITFFDEPGGDPVLRIGLEIKTENPDGYEKLRAPKDEHIDQAHVYMACLNVPMFWFFYMNKGNQNNTNSEGPFLVIFDPARWAKLEAKFQECFDWADKGELPPREESMVCQFCSYSYTCQPPSLIQPRKKTQVWRPA